MDVVKCGMPRCKNYFDSAEGNKVVYQGKSIWICEVCDDGTLQRVQNNSIRRETQQVEKIKRKRRRDDD